MKQYKLFKNPSGSVEAVKQGWSWPAFFFSFIWAMVKKMWGIGVGVLIGCFVVGLIIGLLFSDAGSSKVVDLFINLLAIILNIIFGVKGNSWREKSLLSHGYELVGTVTAANPESAVAMH